MQLRSPNNFFAPDNDLTKVDDYLALSTAPFNSTPPTGGAGDYLLYARRPRRRRPQNRHTPTGYNASDFDRSSPTPNRIILHVVPEPTALALLLSITSLFPRRRFRKIAF